VKLVVSLEELPRHSQNVLSSTRPPQTSPHASSSNQLYISTAAKHHGRQSDIFACLSLHVLPPVFQCLHTKNIPEISWLSKFICIARLSCHISPLSYEYRALIPHSRPSAYDNWSRIDSQLSIGMLARHHQSSSPFALALHTDSRPPSSSLQTTSNNVRSIGDVSD
jgi:hypothetical protein